jgi:hypothetical protein
MHREKGGWYALAFLVGVGPCLAAWLLYGFWWSLLITAATLNLSLRMMMLMEYLLHGPQDDRQASGTEGRNHFRTLRSYIGSVDWRAAFSILGKIVTSAVIVMIVGGVFNANLPLVEAYLAGFGLLLHGSWAFGRLTRLFGSSAKRTSPSVNEAHKLESRLPQWAWQVIWGVAIAVANIFSASLIFCAGIPLVISFLLMTMLVLVSFVGKEVISGLRSRRS